MARRQREWCRTRFAEASLPPRNLRLPQEIQRIRDHIRHVEEYNATQPEVPLSVAIPSKYLFADIFAEIASSGHPVIGRICATYDPSLEPVRNLPGGKMTANQRMFVDRIWRPQLRPQLVRAGFPRIATIGG